MQGHDPAVISGAKSLLQAKRVTILYFEYHRRAMKNDAFADTINAHSNSMGIWKTVTLRELEKALDSMGYECYFEGTPTLTRITGCWMDDYEFKNWCACRGG